MTKGNKRSIFEAIIVYRLTIHAVILFESQVVIDCDEVIDIVNDTLRQEKLGIEH